MIVCSSFVLQSVVLSLILNYPYIQSLAHHWYACNLLQSLMAYLTFRTVKPSSKVSDNWNLFHVLNLL